MLYATEGSDMDHNDPQPQELFGKPLNEIENVWALDGWWDVPTGAHIERGNLHLDKTVFPLKEVRGIRW